MRTVRKKMRTKLRTKKFGRYFHLYYFCTQKRNSLFMKRLFLLSIVTFVSYLPYASVTAATNNYSLGNDKEDIQILPEDVSARFQTIEMVNSGQYDMIICSYIK